MKRRARKPGERRSVFVQLYGYWGDVQVPPMEFLGARRFHGLVGDTLDIPVPADRRVRRIIVTFPSSPEGA